MKRAKLYIQGEVCIGKVVAKDSQTYIATVYVFELENGKFKGEKVAIFENGDKFMEWV